MLSPSTPSVRFSVIAVTALAVAVLSGCADAPRASPETADSRPLAVVENAAEPVDLVPAVPSMRYDIDCAGLAPADVISAALGSDGISAREPQHERISPVSYTVRHLGGLECSWSNDEPRAGADGTLNPAHESIDVVVLPDPEGKFADVYDQDAPLQFGEGSATGCAGTGTCQVDVTARGSWVEIVVIGLDVQPGAAEADVLAQARPLIETIIDRIPEPTTPGAAIGTADCTIASPGQETLLALGITDPWVAIGRTGGGPYNLWEASREYAGTERCVAGHQPGDRRAADTLILPGGAWAFGPGEAGSGVAKGTEPVSVPGTSTPDSYLACEVGQNVQCSLDLAVGADWVRLDLSTREVVGPVSEQDRTDILALGALVVGNLT